MQIADTDSNLLFGVIAMQSGLIDMRQFVDACTLWASHKVSSLADVLVHQGWIVDEDRQHVEYLLQRRLKKQGGNARASLASVPADVQEVLKSLGDDAIRALPDAAGARIDVTVDVPFPETSSSGDRVTLKGLHSSGGMGQVWVAYDRVLGREIALKELRADRADSIRSRERFHREAQLTGQLEHPGIVPVYEFHNDEAGHRCYYTMRFVRGRTLTEVIRQYHEQRRVEQKAGLNSELLALLNVFVSICQTIAYAHSRNVIHRDLKGDNVILGDFGEVIVLDWGLAKRLDEPHEPVESEDPFDPFKTVVVETLTQECPTSQSPQMTLPGEKLGTPAYMAPEQAQGQIEGVGTRTDVYGLAAILYEILVGEPPFLGRSIVEILNRVIHDAPKPPREILNAIPAELERICLQGLAKNPEERQQSAAELASQVSGWIAERAERKRTEQERERFFNLSLDLLAIVTPQGGLTQTNPAWQTILGWSAEELSRLNVWDILHPDEHSRWKQNFARILDGESLTSLEHRCRRKDGAHRWIQWNARLIQGEAAIYLVGRDVTERKQAERTFEELLESAPDAMVVVNEAGRIVLTNAQLEPLFGFTRQELLGQPIEILVPEESRARHPAYVAGFLANPEARPMASRLQLRGRHRDGRVFPVEISLSPVRTEQGLLVSCAIRDVTQRQKETQRLLALLDSAPDAMIVANASQKIVFVNRQTELLFGYERQDLLNQPLEFLIPERFRAVHPAHFAKYLTEAQPRPMGSDLRLYGQRKDGREIPVEISLSSVETTDGILVSCAIREVKTSA